MVIVFLFITAPIACVLTITTARPKEPFTTNSDYTKRTFFSTDQYNRLFRYDATSNSSEMINESTTESFSIPYHRHLAADEHDGIKSGNNESTLMKKSTSKFDVTDAYDVKISPKTVTVAESLSHPEVLSTTNELTYPESKGPELSVPQTTRSTIQARNNTPTTDAGCSDFDSQADCDMLKRVLSNVVARSSTHSTVQSTTTRTTNMPITTTDAGCPDFDSRADCELLRHVLSNAKTPSIIGPALTLPNPATQLLTTKSTNQTRIPTSLSLTSQQPIPSQTIKTTSTPIPTRKVQTTTLNFIEMMKDILKRSYLNASTTNEPYTDYKALLEYVLNRNRTNVDKTEVNSVLKQLEHLVHGNAELSLSNATGMLSEISEWGHADNVTLQYSSSVISGLVEIYKANSTTFEKDSVQATMQNILFAIENLLKASVSSEVSISTTAIEIVTHVVEKKQSSVEITTSGGTIILSQKLFIRKIVRVSTVVFERTIGDNLEKTAYGGAEVSSQVMGVILQNMNGSKSLNMPVHEQGAIIITLPTEIKRREKKRICSYWNFKKKGWASDGGRILEKNDTHTTCQFDHLTNFAVLVLYFDDDDSEISVSHENVLMIMTTVGCSISITCLGMTIIAFVYLRMICKETILIHGNLSVALLIGQLVLVASDEALDHTVACKIVAMVMHYFFLSSFTWMLVEGIALYLSCTRGFYDHGDHRRRFFFVGWGIPLVIVVISVGAEFPQYGTGERHSCWLSTDDGLIWAFMGPMLLIILFNVFVLGIVVKVFLSLETNAKKSDAAKLRSSIRAMAFLLPLLGVTWLLSILVPLHVAFHYLFVVGNSLQGMMIFFLHCICNEEIRKKFIEHKKKLSSTYRTYGDSEVGIRRPKKADNFCDVQLELPSTDRKYAWVS